MQPPTIKCAHVHLVKVSVLMNISFFFIMKDYGFAHSCVLVCILHMMLPSPNTHTHLNDIETKKMMLI